MDTDELRMQRHDSRVDNERLLTKDFVLLCLSGLCFVLSNNVVNPIIPLYIVQMGGTQAEVGVIMSLRTFAALTARPLAGMLVDKGRLVSLMAFGGLNSLLGGLSYIFVPSVSLVGAVEAFKGLGMAAYSTSGSTIVADLASPRRRGEAVGIFSVTGPVAMAFGPAVGLALLARTNFANIFVLSAILGLVSLLLAIQMRPPKVERPASAPLKLINKDVLLPSGAMVCVSFAVGPLYAFIPLYATQNGMGDPGLFFTVYAASMFLVRLSCGKLSDAHGRVAVFVPGALMMALASLYLSTGSGYWGLVLVGALLQRIALGLAQPHPAEGDRRSPLRACRPVQGFR